MCIYMSLGFKRLRLHTHTLRICNTHSFSTATIARTRLNVTLHVLGLSCYNHCDVLCKVPYDAGYLRCIQEFCAGMLK